VDRKYLLDTFPEWKSIQAFQDGIVTVVSADLTQRPGPRLWQGLSAIESILSSWSASRIAPSP
ncbi:MAG: hypothetical protein CL946_09915, partial [Ectothiorhodospiraceae bacterium]|nr:hypothetical protein [Ectothiorhodospiraceae bacterium]